MQTERYGHNMKISGIRSGSETVRKLLKLALVMKSTQASCDISEQDIDDTIASSENVYVLSASGVEQDHLHKALTEIVDIVKEIPQGTTAPHIIAFFAFNNGENLHFDALQKITEFLEKTFPLPLAEAKIVFGTYIDETLDKEIEINIFVAQ